MRILIVGPPRAGNKWLKCLLGRVYRLKTYRDTELPDRPNTEAFLAWAAAGGFEDNHIFHQHYQYDPALVEACRELGVTLVTILRDPRDLWRSSFVIQQRGPRLRQTEPTRLYGHAIDSEVVLEQLRSGSYRKPMKMGLAWLESGATHITRYEALTADPVSALTELTNRIQPVAPDVIAAATEFCSADAMRTRNARSVSAGRGEEFAVVEHALTEAHFAIFRGKKYARLIRRLGYPPR